MNEKEVPLKKIRLSIPKSRAELARDAEIDVKTLAAIEAGTRPGNDVTREKIRQAINRNKLKGTPFSEESLFGPNSR